MKLKQFSTILTLTALVLAGCAVPTTIKTSELKGKESLTAKLNKDDQNFLSVTSVTSTLTPATAQTITVKTNVPLDLSGTTVPGLFVYALSDATSATASYPRGSAITYTAVQNNYGSSSDVVLTLDLTGQHAKVEVVLKADTVEGFGMQLDTDGDGTPGQATDDFVSFRAVTGGTAFTQGVNENPQGSILITPTATLFSDAIGGTTLTLTVTDTAGGNNVTVASFFTAGGFTAQKFDYETKAWTDISTVVTGTAPTFTVTLPASLDGVWYRYVFKDQGAAKESVATNGYIHKFGYATTKLVFLDETLTVGGTGNEFQTADSTFAYTGTGSYVYKTFSTASDSTNTDGLGRNVVVKVIFSGLGSAGLDPASVTTDTVRLYDNDENILVPWSSFKVLSSSSSSLNDTLVLTLPSNYQYQGDNGYLCLTGLIDQGATTTGTGKAKAYDLSDVTNGPDLTNYISLNDGL
jgi:hypothetical protein